MTGVSLVIRGFMIMTEVTPKPVEVSNETAKDLFVAICFSPDRFAKEWTTIGWFGIVSGSTETIQVPVARVGGIAYAYARTRGGKRTWGGDDARFGIATPTYGGKLTSSDRFRVHEPKNSAPEIHHSTRPSRLMVVSGKKMSVGMTGGSFRFI